VKRACIDWLRQHGDFAMGPDCSLPVIEGTVFADALSDQGKRCSLREYARAVWPNSSWEDFVARMERPGVYADPLCLFAVAEVYGCSVVVCSKTFPFAEVRTKQRNMI
jgi:hypothetical protein